MSAAPQLLSIELEPTGPGRFAVAARMGPSDDMGPSLWRGAHACDPDALIRELDGLQRAREVALSRPGEPCDATLAGHGQLVFDLILPPAIKRIVRSGRVAALMVFGGPDGHAVPWALLHDGEAFLGRRLALAEGRTVAQWSPPPSDTRPPRTLIIADPAGDLPAARAEGEVLASVLGAVPDPPPYDLRLGRLTRSELLRALRSYTVLHYAGHVDPADGARPPGWRLADGAVEPGAIAPLVGGPVPRLVVANACRSMGPVGEALLAAGVHHVIGSDVDLPDLQGADFARDLHRALVAGETVGEALRRARAQAAERGDPAWTAYRLVGDPRTRFARPTAAELPTRLRSAVVMVVRRPIADGDLEARVAARRAWRARIGQVVSARGGTLLPIAGRVDRVVFGLAHRREDDALQAARAAVTLADEALDAVVTLDCGRLAVAAEGPIGGPLDRAEIQCWQRGTGVHPGAAIRPALGAAVRLADDGRVLGLARRAASSGPFVGRNDEIDRITRMAAGVEGGRGAALLLAGPAGIGKTRLLEVIRDRLTPRFTVVQTAEAEQGPFGGVAGLVRALCGLTGDEAPDAVRTRIQQTLDAAPDLGDFLSIDDLLDDVDDTRSRQVDVLETMLSAGASVEGPTHAAVAPAVRALVDAVAHRGPLALLLEDLHLMPQPALAVVEALVDPPPPALLLLTARPGAVADRMLAAHQRLDLAPLTERAGRALLSMLLPDASGAVLERLQTRAEGNPLFLEALARHPADDDAPLPDSIEALMQADIDRLDPSERTALSAAAVLGRTFWAAGVQRLLGRDVSAELARLSEARLVVPEARSALPGQAQWRFAHGLLHAVAERALPRVDRTALHGRAALWLDDEVDGPRPARAARIARHRQAAGDLERAVDDWLAAAAHAEASLAPEEARRALLAAEALHPRLAARGRAPAAAARADLSARLGEYDRLAGDFDTAAARFEAAIAQTPPDAAADRAWRASRLAAIELARGRAAAAQGAVERALSAIEAEGVPPYVVADVQHRAAWLECRRGEPDAARARLERLLAELPADESRGRAMAWRLIGTIAQQQGDAEQAHVWMRRALAASSDEAEQVRVLHGLALVAVQRGEYREAAAHYARTVRIRARRGDRAGLAKTYGNLGSLCGEQGDYPRAERYLSEAVRIRRQIGHASLAISHANLADLYLRWGRLDAAATELQHVHALLEAERAPGWARGELWRIIADVQLQRGELDGARETVTRSIEASRAVGDRLTEASAIELDARIAVAAGEPERAIERFEAAIERFEALEATGPLLPTLERLAALVEADDPDYADELRRTRALLTPDGG